MPELIEVEMYRRDLDALVGLPVESVELQDERAIRPKGTPEDIMEVLLGMTLSRTLRHGKLLIAVFVDPPLNRPFRRHGETEGCGVSLGVRFGMTGRLLIDGNSCIEHLEYSSKRNDPAWDRFALSLGGHRMVLRDQRCLGSVELDPELAGLAPDAATLTTEQLSAAFAGRSKAIKSALLDQTIVAGLGNLLADEVLWAVGLSPLRPVDTLASARLEHLASQIRKTVQELGARGGSHTGVSFPLRHEGALCARCSGSMRRDRVGGRTAWWCSTHQV